MAKACSLARNSGDIQDSFDSLSGTINKYGKNDGHFAEVAGPGFFNDPDMVHIIGLRTLIY